MSVSRLLLVMLLVLGPALSALGCPVCFDTSDQNVLRFYSISTLFLSFVPFALIGGVVLAAWHLRRSAAMDDEPPPQVRTVP